MAKRPGRAILPFAGITLIRFYGYISVPVRAEHPEESIFTIYRHGP